MKDQQRQKNLISDDWCRYSTTLNGTAVTKAGEFSTHVSRRQIYREIHDGLGHHLACFSISLERLANQFQSDSPNPSESSKLVDQLISYTEKATDDLRRAVEGKTPIELEESGLAMAIDTLIAKTQNLTGIEVSADTFVTRKNIPSYQWPDVFRLIQESIGNVVKRRSATHVSIRVRNELTGLCILVQDNGAEPENMCGGRILPSSMNQRLSELGGKAELTRVSGDGLNCLVITIPK